MTERDRGVSGLLGKLAGDNAFICRKYEGAALMLPAGQGKMRRAGEVDAQLLVTLLAQELVQKVVWDGAREGETYFGISQTGRAHLRRHQAMGKGADPFRDQHIPVIAEPMGNDLLRRRYQAESPLEWLSRRRGKDGEAFISRDQFNAGERLRRDFTFAQLEPRVTGSWSPVARTAASGFTGEPEISARAVDAKQRFYRALDMVGPGLCDILVEVCCHLSGLAEAERKLDWPARSGKVVLGIALDHLVRHYGMVATGPARGRIQGGHTESGKNRNKILD